MKLTAEKSALNAKYQLLKLEIREIETIRRYAEGMARIVAPPQKTWEKTNNVIWGLEKKA